MSHYRLRVEKLQPCLGALFQCDNRGGSRYAFSKRIHKMAAIDEDDNRPRKKPTHEIGQDLALLSLEELSERIAVLQGEIQRLEATRAKKQASRSTADQF